MSRQGVKAPSRVRGDDHPVGWRDTACDHAWMKHPRSWTPFERVAVGMGVGWAVVIAAIVLNVAGVLG